MKLFESESIEDMRSWEQELTFKEATEIFMAHKLAFTKVQMQTLGIVDAEGLYTNLGLLLSDQCPHIIKAAIFQDTTQNAFQSRREFTGSLFKQLRDAYSYLDMTNNLRSTFSGLERIDKRDYPEAAVREALLNSIVHRDYSINASTLLSVYTDRMEFVSIGGLLPGIQKNDVLLGLSVCRNPKLANVFYRLNLIEAYGTGLPKIMGAYAQYTQEPQIITTPGAFKVLLPNTYYMQSQPTFKVCEEQATYGSYGESAAVMRYIQAHPATSRAEIAASLDLSASKTVRILKVLREKQRIRTEGNGKNICYFAN